MNVGCDGIHWIGNAAAHGDPLVHAVLEDVAGYLGIGSANLVNILNPRMIIVGGRVARQLPQLVPMIEHVLRRRAMAVPAAAVEVVPSVLGDNVVPIGAAAFLLSQVSKCLSEKGDGQVSRSATRGI